MKLPRDLSGEQLARALCKRWAYEKQDRSRTFKPTKKSPLISQKKHNFNAHHLLLSTAKTTLNDAKGRSEYQLATMVMCAFASEALCNSIGSVIINEWDGWKPTLEKLGALTKELKFEYDEKNDSYVVNHETVNYGDETTDYVSIYKVTNGLITEVRFVRD